MAQKNYASRPRTQKLRKTPSGDWLYCSFSAHPEEIEKWRESAAQMDRSLSWWIRNVLNKAVNGVEKEQANEKNPANGSSVPVEEISTDRPRSDFES